MRTRLIRIVEDQTEASLFDRMRTAAVDQPSKGAVVGVLAAPVAIISYPLAIAAAAVLGAGSVLAAKRSQHARIAELKRNRTRRYRDADGQPLLAGRIYAEHPHPVRRRVFLATEVFHDLIVKEQMAQITRFLRNAVPLRTLTIDVISLKTGKVQGAIPLKGKVAEAGGTIGTGHTWTASWHNPVRVPCDVRELYWMDEFPEISAAVDQAASGSFSRSMKVESSFGLTAGLAKAAEINASWMSGLRFDIVAEYG